LDPASAPSPYSTTFKAKRATRTTMGIKDSRREIPETESVDGFEDIGLFIKRNITN
jgi:hypothetical protein